MPIHQRPDLLEKLATPTNRRYYLAGIPDGTDGIRMTLRIMAKMVRAYKHQPLMVELARAIVADVPAKNGAAEVDAIRRWIMEHVRYTSDVNGVESLQTPDALLESLQGDCDDQATLMATLAEAIGKSTRFKAVAFAPDQFEHVFPEVRLGPGWVSAETTEEVELGWKPPNVVSAMIEHV